MTEQKAAELLEKEKVAEKEAGALKQKEEQAKADGKSILTYLIVPIYWDSRIYILYYLNK